MSLEIFQTSALKDTRGGRRRYWDWSVWLDGPADELDAVDRVEYRLHPTFARPIRTVADRVSKFRLDGSAWGEFRIRVIVHKKAGEPEELVHWLHLEVDASSKEPAPLRSMAHRDAPAIFFSYASVDGELVDGIVTVLRNRGIRCLVGDDVPMGVSLASGIEALIEQADFAVAIISDAYGGWIEREIELLRRMDKPLAALVVGELRRVPAFLDEMKALPVRADEAPEHIADMLLSVAPVPI